MLNIDMLCKKDCYNFLSPYGLGDTLMLCGLKNAFEQKYNGEIHFIIKPTHEFIMKLYNIKNYDVINIDADMLKHQTINDPIIGQLYIAHMVFNDYGNSLLSNYSNFLTLYKQFLKLDEGDIFETPSVQPSMSDKSRQYLSQFGNFENMVLLAPNATSTQTLNIKFWNKIAKQMTSDGYTVLVNNELRNLKIKKAININLPIEDTVALGLMCHKVFSLRSGLCDILAQYNVDLTVFYADKTLYERYSINKIFNKSNFREELLPEELKVSNKKELNIFQKIFSIVNKKQDYKNYKVITILGLQIKIKRSDYE